MTNNRAATAAVLDEMVAGIMGIKETKASQLTPVGTESAKLAGAPSDLPGAFMSKEGMRDAAKDLRRYADLMVEIADGLDALSGFATTPEGEDTTKVERKEAERAADVKHATAYSPQTQEIVDRMDKLKKEAEASVFGDVGDVATPAPVEAGWECPKHGSEDLRPKTSGSGREYKVCGVPNCKQFERKR